MINTKVIALASALMLAALAPRTSRAQDLVRTESYVTVTSTAPAMKGQPAKLYIREVKLKAGPSRGVVLFVHGGGTPSEASFDLPYQDYSWMAYLAKAGFDVFGMDFTGYGRSTRPPPMADPCNIEKVDQPRFIPAQLAVACPPSYQGFITTAESNWDDISAVVDHLLATLHVNQVALVGWSAGGPRTAGYTARHPDKVSKLVLLAPGYNRDGPLTSEGIRFDGDGPMNIQAKTDLMARWNGQVGCPDQYDPAAAEVVWKTLVASDAVGSTWTPAVRRQPRASSWGFNKAVVAKITQPYLMISGAWDKQVPQPRVRELYEDLGSTDRVFIDLACSGHSAMWEKNHLMVFKASLDWLTTGKVEGVSHGMLKMGY